MPTQAAVSLQAKELIPGQWPGVSWISAESAGKSFNFSKNKLQKQPWKLSSKLHERNVPVTNCIYAGDTHSISSHSNPMCKIPFIIKCDLNLHGQVVEVVQINKAKWNVVVCAVASPEEGFECSLGPFWMNSSWSVFFCYVHIHLSNTERNLH